MVLTSNLPFTQWVYGTQSTEVFTIPWNAVRVGSNPDTLLLDYVE